MATILSFPVISKDCAVPAVQPGASAQILFFTGVRYERVEPATPRRIKRDEPKVPIAS